MDKFSLAAANLLVGNPEGAAALEAVFQGPEIRFDRDAVVAVCGAHMPPKIDGAEQPDWTSFAVKSGQTLSFGFLKSGARAYIAVAGGVDVPPVLGSRSTYPLGALGGFEGRALKAGDRVEVGSPIRARESRAGACPPNCASRSRGTPELRVLPGLYWHRLTEEAGKTFFEDVWKVAPEADRIGYRFRGGRALSFVPRKQPFGAGSDPSNIVDSCYPIRIDPGSRRHGTHRPSPRRGVGRRVFHARNRHLGRHGPDRPVATAPADALRQGRYGNRLESSGGAKSHGGPGEGEPFLNAGAPVVTTGA